MYLMYQYHHIYNQNIGTSPTSTVNSGDSVGGGGLSSMTPMELMGPEVSVFRCALGFLQAAGRQRSTKTVQVEQGLRQGPGWDT